MNLLLRILKWIDNDKPLIDKSLYDEIKKQVESTNKPTDDESVESITAKEKAKKLVMKYRQFGCLKWDEAKQCALIAVEETLKSRPALPSPNPEENMEGCLYQANGFWNEVKSEISKL